MSVPFDLLLGRKTYDIFAAYWPFASEEEGAKPLNDATKYVASRSPRVLTWERSVQIEGDVADRSRRTQAQRRAGAAGARQWRSGQTLMRHGLV